MITHTMYIALLVIVCLVFTRAVIRLLNKYNYSINLSVVGGIAGFCAWLLIWIPYVVAFIQRNQQSLSDTYFAITIFNNFMTMLIPAMITNNPTVINISAGVESVAIGILVVRLYFFLMKPNGVKKKRSVRK